MSDHPAIVIQTYQRPQALSRLLASLDRAIYDQPTTLIVSIDQAQGDHDGEGVAAVTRLAKEFAWRHGRKQIIAHSTNLGLTAHHLYCQSLIEEVGPIILLEDDLVVSATFHQYSTVAMRAYREDLRVAGVSLNALWYNGLTRQPFIPVPDAFDVFFLQLSTPQGQVYTPEQWRPYRAWLAANDQPVPGDSGLHELLAGLPATDWLPTRDRYLLESGCVYVYPRQSQTVNFGDVGTHFDQETNFFQVPLQQLRERFRFASLDESMAVYDSFFEMRPDRLSRLAPRLRDYSFSVDLYATKQPGQLDGAYVVTTRPVRRAVWTAGKWLLPLETNLFGEGTPGSGIALARREDVDMSRWATLAAQHDNDRVLNGERSDSLPAALASRLRRRWSYR